MQRPHETNGHAVDHHFDALQQPTTLRDLCRVLFRHKFKSISFFCLAVAAGVAGVLFLPRSYESEAKLFVRVGRESVTLDPTATTGPTLSLYESRESEINSVVELLRSREIAERVVDELGPDVILAKEEKQEEAGNPLIANLRATLSLWKKSLLPQEEISDRERAILFLEQEVGIGTPRRSSIISVVCRTKDPKLSQKIVTTFVDVYLKAHAELHRTHGSHEFFMEQESLLRQQLQDANQALRDAKNKFGVASIDDQRKILQDRMGEVETEILRGEAALAASAAKVGRIQLALSEDPERLTTLEMTGVASAASDSMRQQLYALELRERELRAKFRDVHPLVVGVQRQVAEAREILEKEGSTRIQATQGISPVREKLELDLVGEQTEAASLTARLDALRLQQKDLRKQLAELNDYEVRIGNLQRQVDLLDANYRTYAGKVEEARIDASLQDERITNVNVAQPASLAQKPVAPKKALLLGLGLMVGTLGGLGLAIAAEFLDQSFKTPGEVEQVLELPVLVSIPRVPTNRVFLRN